MAFQTPDETTSAPLELTRALADSSSGLVRAIMIGTKPTIPGDVDIAVVAFEETVMQLVVKVGRLDQLGVLDKDFLESSVG